MAKRLEEILAARIRELATERRMPISHVADRCGLAHSYFWSILRADASASLAVVQRLASALDVDPLMLLSSSKPAAMLAVAERPADASRAPHAPRRRRKPALRRPR